MTSDLIIRPANSGDLALLTTLLDGKSFVHRHLGWRSAFDWLGSQPFLILEDQERILAALACPPDEDGLTWLQLFASAPGYSTFQAWNNLWPQAKSVLERNDSVASINSLVIHPEMDRLLKKDGFKEIYQVVILVWDISRAAWPAIQHQGLVRLMEAEDLDRVHRIDQLAFNEIWRNSLSHLETAYKQAFSAAVIELDGNVQGYQISTATTRGGHLARLAINPEYQSLGLGSSLLTDLLDRFQERGIVEVTVNTQSVNQRSLDLYQKFGFVLLDDRYPVRQYLFTNTTSGIDQG